MTDVFRYEPWTDWSIDDPLFTDILFGTAPYFDKTAWRIPEGMTDAEETVNHVKNELSLRIARGQVEGLQPKTLFPIKLIKNEDYVVGCHMTWRAKMHDGDWLIYIGFFLRDDENGSRYWAKNTRISWAPLPAFLEQQGIIRGVFYLPDYHENVAKLKGKYGIEPLHSMEQTHPLSGELTKLWAYDVVQIATGGIEYPDRDPE